jgi:carbonic anhydrase
MAELDRLMQNNRAWEAAQHVANREYFSRLALKQTPKFL